MNRNILTVCVCLAGALSALGQSNQGSGYLFELPGPSSASGQFYYSIANASGFPPSPTAVPGGPAGLTHIAARPDGGQFYLVSPGNLQTANSSFTNFGVLNLDQPPTAVAVSPDGKYVLAGTDQLYIIDANADQIVAQLPLPGLPNFASDQPAGTPPCPSCWIAFSQDSSMAYVLTNSSNARVTTINLATHTVIASPPALSLQFGDATGITLSPLGLLYVTAANRIYEVNPATMQVTSNGTVQLNFWPARLKFTPDGTNALAVNYTPATGGESLMELTIANYGVSYWPAYNAIVHPYIPGSSQVTLSDVLIANNSKAYALSSASSLVTPSTLYDVTFNPFNAAESVIGAGSGVAVNDVNSAAISSEVPAQYLYLLSNLNLTRIDLATPTTVASQTAPLTPEMLEFALIPPQTGAASFLPFGNNQTVAGGAVSSPLIARVLNAAGQPVFNVPVSFAADTNSAAAGLTVATPSATTNANGYVQTTITAPSAPGNYNVILTAGTVTETFSLTVPCSGASCGSGTGTGSGNGSNQVSIVSGNGQLLSASFPETLFPLTIKVTDTSGNSLPNVPVAFSSPTGSVTNPTTETDQHGLASTSYGAQLLSTTAPFQTDIVNALTSYGQVNFTVTEVPSTNITPVLIQPMDLINPNDITNTFSVPEGSVLPNAFEAVINSEAGGVSTPIPGVGIDILDQQTQMPTAASCQGAPVSDATGTVICNIVAVCVASNVSLPQSFAVYFDIGGGYLEYPGTITLTAGTASVLNKTAGDSQHGSPGQTLPLSLQVTVTNGCGSPVAGTTVNWTVSPAGAATLVNTTTVSNQSGQVSTFVTLGQTAGTITVTASYGASTVVFTLTNQVSVSGISLSSGGGQTAVAGQAFAQPVVFLAHDANGNPVAGAAVNFSATNGATVNPASGITNAQGMVSTAVTAGSALGSVVVTATLGSFSATATLTAQAPGPAITASSFVNSATGAVGLVACGLGSVFGNGIAPNVQGVVSGLNPIGPLPYNLNGFSMTIGGIPAPIQALANQNGQQQANFQTPCEVPAGPTTVVVTSNGETVTVTGVQVLAAQPGQYPSPVQGAAGITYGAVISATDGSLVTLTNPAHLGQNYYLIATGLGQVTPAAQTDSVGVAGQSVNLPVVVGVDNAGVAVISATYAQGAIGAYLVEFQIPANAPTGTNQPLALAVVINNQLVFGNTLVMPAVEQ